jgi:hypothetical protein
MEFARELNSKSRVWPGQNNEILEDVVIIRDVHFRLMQTNPFGQSERDAIKDR